MWLILSDEVRKKASTDLAEAFSCLKVDILIYYLNISYICN